MASYELEGPLRRRDRRVKARIRVARCSRGGEPNVTACGRVESGEKAGERRRMKEVSKPDAQGRTKTTDRGSGSGSAGGPGWRPASRY